MKEVWYRGWQIIFDKYESNEYTLRVGGYTEGEDEKWFDTLEEAKDEIDRLYEEED